MLIRVPLKTINPLNRREHWAVRSSRVKRERELVTLWARAAKFKVPPLPLIVTMTRIAPRKLDPHDALPASFKGAADALCALIGVDDRTEQIDWRYRQQRGEPREYAIQIEVQPA